jgi:DNA-binding transcriptional LysR family regulator
MRNLSLRQLRAILEIERTGRISAAAQALGLTGPAVTLQLKQIEEEAGIALFDRMADGMRPTEAGEIALAAAREVMERLRLLDEELSELKGGSRGTLRLGAVSTAKYFTPRLIAGFRAENPDIHVDLFIGNRAETIEALRQRRIDIALMGRPPRDLNVSAAVFGDHPLVIVAPPDHPLARRRDISKEQLAEESFLIREPGSGTRISLEIFFADLPGKLDDLGAEMGSNETIKQAVMAGLGIAFISAHTIEQELQLGRLAILDVAGLPIRRQWFSVRLAERVVSPAMRLLEEFLARKGAQFLPLVPKTYPPEAVFAYAPTPLPRRR